MDEGLTVCLSARHSDFLAHEAELQAYFQTFQGTEIAWFLVIQADTPEDKPTFSQFFEPHIVFSTTSGLSNSRNMGLETCATQHCIFTDFDVRYNIEALRHFSQFLKRRARDRPRVPFFLFRVKRVEGEVSAAGYGGQEAGEMGAIEVDYIDKAHALSQVFSVQICWDVGFVRDHGLCFDPNLGLAPDRRRLNFGEEYLLALNCFFVARKYGVIEQTFGEVQAQSTGLGKGRLEKAWLALYVLFHASKGSPWARLELMVHKTIGKITKRRFGWPKRR
jgi:ribosomal protein S18 acetylase RimI-like enzyme